MRSDLSSVLRRTEQTGIHARPLLTNFRLPFQVDKETNTDEAGDAGVAVRPKDRSGLSARQRPFVRSSVIVRSQTFSPGERSQYICRVRGPGPCPPAGQWPPEDQRLGAGSLQTLTAGTRG